MPPARPLSSPAMRRLGQGDGDVPMTSGMPVKRRQLEPWEVDLAAGASRVAGGGGGTAVDAYTRDEMDVFLSERALVGHDHNGVYQPLGAVLTALSALVLDPSSAGKRVVVNEAGDGFELVDVEIPVEKHWITITATGTGASQDIALYEAVTEAEIFLFADGVLVDWADFSVSGSTLTTTQTLDAALTVRYLGTVDGAIPVNSVAPTISGTAQVGQTLTVSDNGTWSASPTSYTYRWRADGEYITGETGEDFLPLTTEFEGAEISCEVTAHNASGASAPAVSNDLGPVAALDGLTTPELAMDSGWSSGEAPVFKLTLHADHHPGFIIQFQRTSTGTGAAGDYTATDMDVEHRITASEWEAGAITLSALGDDGYENPPGGEYWMRARIKIEGELSVSGWTDEIHDTITASTAALTSITGVDKSQYLTITGAANLSATVNANVNSRCGCRADKPAQGNSFHMEMVIDSLLTSVAFGIIDDWNGTDPAGTGSNLQTATVIPGAASGANGFAVTLTAGNANASFARNGASNGIAIPGGAPVVGDGLIIEGDKTTKVINVWFWRAATSTATLLQTFTLTSKIPSVWNAYQAGWRKTASGVDGFTVNYGASPFLKTATAGVDHYG